MKNVFMFLCCLSLCCGQTKAIEILNENFDAFTNGTVGSPADEDIAASGKLATELPGWSGVEIFEAGGTLMVTSDDWLMAEGGWLSTPSMDLDAANGPVKVTIRMKSADADGNIVNVTFGSASWKKVLENDEWEVCEFMSNESLSGSLKIAPNVSIFVTPVYVDYILVEQSNDLLSAPTALRPIDFDGTTFTARWLPVEGASSYVIEAYSKDVEGNPEYVLQQEVVVENDEYHYVVTVPADGKKYYYRVFAKNGERLSNPSAEQDVVKRVLELGSPVALAATNITATGFTANWEAVADAENYKIRVFKTQTALEEAEMDVVAEDFSGMTEGRLGLAETPESMPEYLNDYTKTPGWLAYNHGYAGGSIALIPVFGSAYLVTPSLDLSKDGGAFTVKVNMAKYDFFEDAFQVGAVVRVVLSDSGNNELESVEVTLDEAGFKTYEVDFTKGCANAFVKIVYDEDWCELYIEDVAVSQVVQAGEKIRSLFGETTTTGLSADFEAVAADNVLYSYVVWASVNTVNELGMDTEVTSASSNEVVVVEDGGGIADSSSLSGVKVGTRVGCVSVVLPSSALISVYDASGRQIASVNGNAGENLVPAKGFVIVKVGTEIFKALVR